MESDSVDAKNQLQQRECNEASKISSPFSSEEQDLGLDLEARSPLQPSSPVKNGCGGEGEADEEKRLRKGSTRRVHFNDCSLTQVLEFQPSTREDAISLCAQLCIWLCGKSSDVE